MNKLQNGGSGSSTSEFYGTNDPNFYSDNYRSLTDNDVKTQPNLLLDCAQSLKAAYYYQHKLEAASAYMELITLEPETKNRLAVNDNDLLQNAYNLLANTAEGSSENRPDQSAKALLMLTVLKAQKRELEDNAEGNHQFIKDLAGVNKFISKSLEINKLNSTFKARLVGIAHEVAAISLINAVQFDTNKEIFKPIAWPTFVRHDQFSGNIYKEKSGNYDVLLGSYDHVENRLQIKSTPYKTTPTSENFFNNNVSITEFVDDAKIQIQNRYQDDICVLFAGDDFANGNYEVNRLFANWSTDTALPEDLRSTGHKLLETISNYYSIQQ